MDDSNGQRDLEERLAFPGQLPNLCALEELTDFVELIEVKDQLAGRQERQEEDYAGQQEQSPGRHRAHRYPPS